MPLTTAQRSSLRGLAMQRDVDLSIGRHGITPNVVDEIDRILRKQELAKLRFNSKDATVRGQLLAEISAALDAEVVGSVGHTASLYRYSDEATEHLIQAEELRGEPGRE